jgi:hypothetical protein
VVVHGDGDGALGEVLADNVLVEVVVDLARLGDGLDAGAGLAGATPLFADQVVTQLDAGGADEDIVCAFDHGPGVAVALATETAHAGTPATTTARRRASTATHSAPLVQIDHRGRSVRRCSYPFDATRMTT